MFFFINRMEEKRDKGSQSKVANITQTVYSQSSEASVRIYIYLFTDFLTLKLWSSIASEEIEYRAILIWTIITIL